MRSKSVVRARGLSELRSSVLRDVAEAYSAYLAHRHLAWVTVETYLRIVAHFARWLGRQGEQVVPVRSHVRTFLSVHLPRCRCRIRVQRAGIATRAALRHLLAVLRAQGRLEEESPRRMPVEEEVARFEVYLRDVRGCAQATRHQRTVYVRQLLSSVFGAGAVDPARVTPSVVYRFVTSRPRPCRPGTLSAITVSVRSYLRFLCLEGRCPAGLLDAVPHVARWRLDSLPSRLSEDELRRFLACFDSGTPRGRRDYAMALCMVVLGLRAVEVAALRLRDVDWRNGRLHVPPTKTRRGRDLPLLRGVGQALIAYLKRGRPRGSTDHLFLRIGVLEGEPLDSACVRSAVRLAYARAGFPKHYTGTHRLRHTAATRLVVRGATAKEVADVLGHADLGSTAIYAKVDLPRLRAVALPWPGRSR
jgi:integrase/recombinase XerD